jgi:hypothetical protein
MCSIISEIVESVIVGDLYKLKKNVIHNQVEASKNNFLILNSLPISTKLSELLPSTSAAEWLPGPCSKVLSVKPSFAECITWYLLRGLVVCEFGGGHDDACDYVGAGLRLIFKKIDWCSDSFSRVEIIPINSNNVSFFVSFGRDNFLMLVLHLIFGLAGRKDSLASLA